MIITDLTHQSTVEDKHLYSDPDYSSGMTINKNINSDLIHIPYGKL